MEEDRAMKFDMPGDVRKYSEFTRELSLDHAGHEIFVGLTREESEEYLPLKLAALADDYWTTNDRSREDRRLELLDKIEAARIPLMMEIIRDEQN